jgi:hypothetical protein
MLINGYNKMLKVVLSALCIPLGGMSRAKDHRREEKALFEVGSPGKEGSS